MIKEIIKYIDRKICWSVYLIIICAPLYLVRFVIFGIPTTLLEVLIYLLFGVWLWRIIANRELVKTVWLGKNSWPIGLLFIGVLIGAFLADPVKSGFGILKGWFFDPWLVFVLIINLKQTKKILNLQIIWVWLWSSSIIAAIALGYFAISLVSFDGRLAAMFLSPNYLAMYLAPGVILAFWLALSEKGENKITATALCVLNIYAIYLTYSYGAWLGVVVGLIWVAVYLYKLNRLSKKILLASGLIIVAIFFWQFGSEKLQSIIYSPTSSWQSRIMIYQSAWKILKDHWFFGIGHGMFGKYYLNYQPYFKPYLEWAVPMPHNIFLAFWLQAGLIGLFGFVGLLYNFACRVKEKISGHIKKETWIYFVQASLMTYVLIHGLIDTTYWKNDLAIFFWIILALNYTAYHRAY